jgi:RHS repeat-associated protein
MLSVETHRGNRESVREGSYGRFLYNYFRTYDPTTGRYLETDPIGQRSGANLYAYVFSSPVNLTDPTGLIAFIVCRRCKGTAGPMTCEVFSDPSSTYGAQSVLSFAANAGTNDPSKTKGDPFGEDGPLAPGTYDLPNAYSPTFKRIVPSPTNTGVPGKVTSPAGTPREGIRVHSGNYSRGCIVTGSGSAGRSLETTLTGIVSKNVGTGGTKLVIVEVDCSKCPPCP